mmetsp:Transcript_18394/g.47805  ORF Transcript_18394/g.47805 Transcript_18394/m.47805 type:complete len:217 (+) Transcript_18394:436-1086(+)
MHSKTSGLSSSLFLARNSSEAYSTGPAKCRTTKWFRRIRTSWNKRFIPYFTASFRHHVSCVPPVTLHSSSSIGRIPDNSAVWPPPSPPMPDTRFRLPSLAPESSSTTALLSGKSSGFHCTHSRAYSAASCSKMTSLKYCCSSSFVKLMQSCSKELCSKNSKPKMSSTPTKGRASSAAAPAPPPPPPTPKTSFTRATANAKSDPYRCLANASRPSVA